jgi:hypothetical protein
MDGEDTCWVHDHFSLDPVELHESQMPQLGGNNAYPDHPFFDSKFEKVLAFPEVLVTGGGVLPPPTTTLI